MSKRSRLFFSMAVVLLVYVGYLIYEWVHLSQSDYSINYVIPFFIFTNAGAQITVERLITGVFVVDFMAWAFWAVSFVRDGA